MLFSPDEYGDEEDCQFDIGSNGYHEKELDQMFLAELRSKYKASGKPWIPAFTNCNWKPAVWNDVIQGRAVTVTDTHSYFRYKSSEELNLEFVVWDYIENITYIGRDSNEHSNG